MSYSNASWLYPNVTETYGKDYAIDLQQSSSRIWSISEICNFYKVLINGFVIGFVSIAGIIGNGLAAFTVWPSRNTKPTSALIIALAVMDSLFDFTMIPNFSVHWLLKYFRPLSWWERVGKPFWFLYVHVFGRFGHYCGTWLIILVTFNRYVAVCHPLRARIWCTVSKTRMQIAIIAIFFGLLSIPRFMYKYAIFTPDGNQVKLIKSSVGEQSFWYDVFYESILYFIFNYAIPVPFLVIMTIKLIKGIKEQNKKRQVMTAKDPEVVSKEERDLNRTMIWVAIVFISCMTPNQIRRAMQAWLPSEQINCGYFYSFFHPLSALMISINTSINFIVYYQGGKTFRKTFTRRVRGLFGLKAKVEPISSLGQSTSATAGGTATRITHFSN